MTEPAVQDRNGGHGEIEPACHLPVLQVHNVEALVSYKADDDLL
jgi:hypothetical protein